MTDLLKLTPLVRTIAILLGLVGLLSQSLLMYFLQPLPPVPEPAPETPGRDDFGPSGAAGRCPDRKNQAGSAVRAKSREKSFFLGLWRPFSRSGPETGLGSPTGNHTGKTGADYRVFHPGSSRQPGGRCPDHPAKWGTGADEPGPVPVYRKHPGDGGCCSICQTDVGSCVSGIRSCLRSRPIGS